MEGVGNGGIRLEGSGLKAELSNDSEFRVEAESSGLRTEGEGGLMTNS